MATRILFFMATASPVGGVATWLDRASTEFKARGYEVIVALTRGAADHDPARYESFHPGLRTIRVDGRGLEREGRIRACMRVIRRVRPDIVVPLGVWEANFAALRVKASGRPLLLIARAQGNLPPMLADLEDLRAGLDRVVCVGALTRQYLLSHAGFEAARVVHIPNGADLPARDRVPRHPGQPLRIGFVGRLMERDKRAMDLVPFCHAMIRKGIPFQLTVVGSGPCETPLRDALRMLGKRVRFTGALPSRAVYETIYPELDVLLLLSSTETFGIVLAEAMMNGVVPVTSRYEGFARERLIVEGATGLAFPVGDLDSAADAVGSLDHDSIRLHALSTAAAQHARHTYTWKRCFDRWHTILEESRIGSPVSPPAALTAVMRSGYGRLDVYSPSVADLLRRVRRGIAGARPHPGGEEWPLFRRDHPPERLDAIAKACRSIDA